MHRALVSDLRLPRCADTSSDMAGHEHIAKLCVPEWAWCRCWRVHFGRDRAMNTDRGGRLPAMRGVGREARP